MVSIFEEHADILRKGTRETVYGHKLYLTCGKSSLITDCMLVRGNPADSGRLQSMLERQNQLYGRYPRQAATDGGFASRSNLDWAKGEARVKDMAFAKKCRLQVEEMAKSPWVIPPVAPLPCRHRRLHLALQACLWRRLLRLEGLAGLSNTASVRGGLQPVDACACPPSALETVLEGGACDGFATLT